MHSRPAGLAVEYPPARETLRCAPGAFLLSAPVFRSESNAKLANMNL